MAVYRARSCPSCRFYVGYSIANPFDGAEAPVESFCLNCNYHLPVRAVVRRAPGIDTRPRDNRSLLRADTVGPSPGAGTRRPNYPRDLRAIGQELERRGFNTFNLKCSTDGYFVWSTETLLPGTRSAGGTSTGAEQDIADDTATKMLLDRIVGFQFTSAQIERLERRGLGNRRRAIGPSERSRLSQLLRTVGEQVYCRGERLLAIAWREQQISVVTRNTSSRCTMDVLRSDNLYDLWVQMYLKRSN
jgi:hypothetical protein